MRRVIGILMVMGVGMLCACGGGGGAPAATGAGGPRVVSTVPAATVGLVAIGGDGCLVGVSKFDAENLPARERGLPVVGDYETMDYERLVGLHPTAVVVQTADSRLSGRLMELAGKEHFEVVNVKLESLADVWDTTRRLGKISGREEEAEMAIADAQMKIEGVKEMYAAKAPVRVVYAVGTNPLMIVGGGSIVDEMIKAAGGKNLGADVGKGFPVIGLETLVQMAPDVLLISDPGGGKDEASEKTRWEMLGLSKTRVVLVKDPHGLMASVEAGNQVEALAAMLHAHPATATRGAAR